MKLRAVLIALISLCFMNVGWSSEIRVAVAANFKPVLEPLAKQYEEKTRHKVLISSASTGGLYNQITRNAPFDLFLSADSERPLKLEKEGLTVPDTRKTYAVGRLVLWDRKKGQPVMTLEGLKSEKGRLAMANPATAPYGLAAQQTLKKLGVWSSFQGRIVQGSSIQQAWQFVASGNVDLGMVALSQLSKDDLKRVTYIPPEYHDPIQQDLVVLKHGRNQKLAQEFANYLLSDVSQAYIETHGYYPSNDLGSDSGQEGAKQQ